MNTPPSAFEALHKDPIRASIAEVAEGLRNHPKSISLETIKPQLNALRDRKAQFALWSSEGPKIENAVIILNEFVENCDALREPLGYLPKHIADIRDAVCDTVAPYIQEYYPKIQESLPKAVFAQHGSTDLLSEYTGTLYFLMRFNRQDHSPLKMSREEKERFIEIARAYVGSITFLGGITEKHMPSIARHFQFVDDILALSATIPELEAPAKKLRSLLRDYYSIPNRSLHNEYRLERNGLMRSSTPMIKVYSYLYALPGSALWRRALSTTSLLIFKTTDEQLRKLTGYGLDKFDPQQSPNEIQVATDPYALLASARVLERARPGSVRELLHRHGIRRCFIHSERFLLRILSTPLRSTLQKYLLLPTASRSPERAERNIMMIASLHDHNEYMRQLRGVEDSILDDLGTSWGLDATEFASPSDLALNLERAYRRRGKKPADLNIFAAHGEIEALIMREGKIDLTALDDPRLIRFGRRYFEGTTILLLSCSTGKEHGFAKKMSERFSCTVVAPSDDTPMPKLDFAESDEGGAPVFNAKFPPGISAVRYVRGALVEGETKKEVFGPPTPEQWRDIEEWAL